MSDTIRLARPTYLFDYLFVGYSTLMNALILVFGRPFGQYVDELAFYVTMIVVAVLIGRFVDEKRSRLHALIRLLYPVILFTFFYRATGGMMSMVVDRFFDSDLTTIEQAILGFEPSLYVDRYLHDWTIVTELMSFGYFAYYFMFPVFLFWAFLRRDDHVLRSSVSAMCLAFYISYLIFVLFPVASPRWFFESEYVNPLTGWIFRPIVELVLGSAGLRGGGMPSSHVAVALVIQGFALRHYPLLGRVMIPVNILLAAGTVWGRFHYISDVAAGIIVAVFALFFVRKFSRDGVYIGRPATVQKESATANAS